MKRKTAGSKIKNPLEFSLQILNEIQLPSVKKQPYRFLLRQQSMDLFNQPNVVWDGGKSWLTTQIYLQREAVADAVCQGRGFIEMATTK
jgi:hypothetical protein